MFPGNLIWPSLRRQFLCFCFLYEITTPSRKHGSKWDCERERKAYKKAHSGMRFSLGTRIKIFHHNSDFCCEPYLNVFSLLPRGFREGKKTNCQTLQSESFSQRQHDHHEQTTKEELWLSPINRKGKGLRRQQTDAFLAPSVWRKDK